MSKLALTRTPQSSPYPTHKVGSWPWPTHEARSWP